MAKNNLLGVLRGTIERHNLIEKGDRVCVGLSGGKDSMALIYSLANYQKYINKDFHLEAITVDPGFFALDIEIAKSFMQKLNVPYTVVQTDIKEIVFDIRNEKNPCSLCANMRRGYLASTMNERGLNKLALGHHEEDALSTFMLNFLHGGNTRTLSYSSFLDKTEITVIRPFLDAKEHNIINFCKINQIPIIKSPCPVDKKTERESMNKLIEELDSRIIGSKKSMLTAIKKL